MSVQDEATSRQDFIFFFNQDGLHLGIISAGVWPERRLHSVRYSSRREVMLRVLAGKSLLRPVATSKRRI